MALSECAWSSLRQQPGRAPTRSLRLGRVGYPKRPRIERSVIRAGLVKWWIYQQASTRESPDVQNRTVAIQVAQPAVALLEFALARAGRRTAASPRHCPRCLPAPTSPWTVGQ